MAAKVLRLFRNVETFADGSLNAAFDPARPTFWTECLAVDSVPPVWSEDLSQFVTFPSYHEADLRAQELRVTDPCHPFAKSIEREANVSPWIAESIPENSGVVLSNESSAASPPRKKSKRKRPTSNVQRPTSKAGDSRLDALREAKARVDEAQDGKQPWYREGQFA